MKKIQKGQLCSACGRYYSRYLVVDPIVIKNGKILLIRRKKGLREGGFWAFPGGIVDWNETCEEAVLRELKEESGVKGEIIKLFGVYADPKREKNDTQAVTVVFLIRFIKQIPDFDKKEVEKIAWFSLDKLPSKIAFDHRKIIKDFISKFYF